MTTAAEKDLTFPGSLLNPPDNREDDLTRLSANARDAGNEYIAAGRALVAVSEALAMAERQRPRQKLAAIARLVEQDHPAAPGKKFSVSQAESVCQLDPEYGAYKAEIAHLELAKLEAEIGLDAARLAAEYAIAAFKVAGGLR